MRPMPKPNERTKCSYWRSWIFLSSYCREPPDSRSYSQSCSRVETFAFNVAGEEVFGRRSRFSYSSRGSNETSGNSCLRAFSRRVSDIPGTAPATRANKAQIMATTLSVRTRSGGRHAQKMPTANNSTAFTSSESDANGRKQHTAMGTGTSGAKRRSFSPFATQTKVTDSNVDMANTNQNTSLSNPTCAAHQTTIEQIATIPNICLREKFIFCNSKQLPGYSIGKRSMLNPATEKRRFLARSYYHPSVAVAKYS